MSGGGLPEWISASTGLRPRVSWAVTTDAPLAALDLARETSETVAADQSGGLYLLDRDGRIAVMNRGYHELTGLAWADTGEAGFIAFDGSQVCYLDRRLKMQWVRRMPVPIHAIACDPYGHHVAVALADGRTGIFNWERKRVAAFATPRPLRCLQFLATEPTLIGVSDYGLLCAYTLDGDAEWHERMWSSVGDLCVAGNGNRIFLASFHQGVQVHDGRGSSRGAYMVEGTVARVSCSFGAEKIMATTDERAIYWIDGAGRILWIAKTPESLTAIRCAPLGNAAICGFESGRIVRLEWPPSVERDEDEGEEPEA